MKYVITGGAGFIGSHIADALAPDNEVIILDDLFSGSKKNITRSIESGAEFRQGSINDPAILGEILSGADGVFHEAAIASVPRSVSEPIPSNEVNITGTLRVLLAARDAGVKKVVTASSSSVYGETPELPKLESMKPSPISPYGVSKYAAEEYGRVFSLLYGMPVISLRYFNVFGPRQDPDSQYAAVVPIFITAALSRKPITINGDGEQTRDFSFVADVVQANLKAMERGNAGVYNIAGGYQITINQLADIIMKETGSIVPPVHLPERKGDIRDSLAEISRANREFGFAPRYTVQKGIRETVDWFREQRIADKNDILR